MSILEELFNGAVNPFESLNASDPKSQEINRKIEKELEKLLKKDFSKLTEEEFNGYTDFENYTSELTIYRQKRSFVYGLKLGIMIMHEVIGGKDDLITEV